MQLSGSWVFTQQWENAPSYQFEAIFSLDGTLTIPATEGQGPWFGVYATSRGDQQGTFNVSMAICDFTPGQSSVTVYTGVLRPEPITMEIMSGSAVGGQPDQKGSNSAVWSAVPIIFFQVPKKAIHVPSK